MMMRLFVVLLAVAVSAAIESVQPEEGKASRNLGFFRSFSTMNKLNRALLDCDYDHPEKARYCPPVNDIVPFPEGSETQDAQSQRELHTMGIQKEISELSQ
ncbi:expressed unknown protein [Seminavis robusta]|uniref:Uncharacterized protein n=1 Tax=Seminavis robusta TaxID=568900 RepID=A0A9N8DHR0_9STRA|nr:expressed unknown protein [Seminavis robusta]|eukprot:Sro149_g068530.1 n/a (101) ;mRNA; f:66159-66461